MAQKSTKSTIGAGHMANSCPHLATPLRDVQS